MRTDSAPRSGTSPRPPDELAAAAASIDTPSSELDLPVRDKHVDSPDSAPPKEQADVAALALPGARAPLSRRARIFLTLGIAAAVLLFLFVVRSVVQPFIWAAVLAYILNPVVRAVERRLHLRHGASVALVVLILAGVVAGSIARAIPILRNDILAFTGSLDAFDSYIQTYLPNAGTPTVLGMQIQIPQIVHNVQTSLNDIPHLFFSRGVSLASGIVETLLRLLTFLLSTVYLLLDGRRLQRWLTGRIPASHRADVTALGRDINTVLSEYLRAEIILILIMSSVSLVALSILGVRFAIILAPIVGFLEIFPIIGPFFAIAMVTLAALIGPPGFGLQRPAFALIVAVIFFILRQIEDYIVIPNVVGHAVKLHPVLILFALLCGATLGGILGMFLAVPVTGVIKVLGSYAYDRLTE